MHSNKVIPHSVVDTFKDLVSVCSQDSNELAHAVIDIIRRKSILHEAADGADISILVSSIKVSIKREYPALYNDCCKIIDAWMLTKV